MAFRKLARFFDFLAQPGAFASLRRRPRSIASFQITSRIHRIAPGLRTIIDGGANVGQFARAAIETFPEARIFSFEPLSDVACAFRRNLSDRTSVTLEETALGETDGELSFYPNSNTQSSSALPLSLAHNASFARDSQLPQIKVPVRKLDTLFAGRELARPLLLKLDLQGYELTALKGAMELLARTDWILVETGFVEMYEGEPLFPAMMSFLRERGFRLRCPVGVLCDDHGSIVQMDALFERVLVAEA